MLFNVVLATLAGCALLVQSLPTQLLDDDDDDSNYLMEVAISHWKGPITPEGTTSNSEDSSTTDEMDNPEAEEWDEMDNSEIDESTSDEMDNPEAEEWDEMDNSETDESTSSDEMDNPETDESTSSDEMDNSETDESTPDEMDNSETDESTSDDADLAPKTRKPTYDEEAMFRLIGNMAGIPLPPHLVVPADGSEAEKTDFGTKVLDAAERTMEKVIAGGIA